MRVVAAAEGRGFDSSGKRFIALLCSAIFYSHPSSPCSRCSAIPAVEKRGVPTFKDPGRDAIAALRCIAAGAPVLATSSPSGSVVICRDPLVSAREVDRRCGRVAYDPATWRDSLLQTLGLPADLIARILPKEVLPRQGGGGAAGGADEWVTCPRLLRDYLRLVRAAVAAVRERRLQFTAGAPVARAHAVIAAVAGPFEGPEEDGAATEGSAAAATGGDALATAAAAAVTPKQSAAAAAAASVDEGLEQAHDRLTTAQRELLEGVAAALAGDDAGRAAFRAAVADLERHKEFMRFASRQLTSLGMLRISRAFVQRDPVGRAILDRAIAALPPAEHSALYFHVSHALGALTVAQVGYGRMAGGGSARGVDLFYLCCRLTPSLARRRPAPATGTTSSASSA